MLRTILVPLDGSPLSEQALPIAGPLAAPTGARLLLVRAAWVPHLADLSPQDAEIHSIQVAEEYLATIKTRLEADGLVVDTAIPFAPAGEGILIEIDLHYPDLVVMSTHGRSGISRLLFGSVAETVVARSSAPVLLVRVARAELPIQPIKPQPAILVPLDGSAFAEAALVHARELALALGGELVLMRAVVPPPQWVDPMVVLPYPTEEAVTREDIEAKTYLTDLVTQLHTEGIRARGVVQIGRATDSILHECEACEADLIIMTTHARTGWNRAVFGSVAMGILYHTDRPILLVNPKAERAGEAEKPVKDPPLLIHT